MFGALLRSSLAAVSDVLDGHVFDVIHCPWRGAQLYLNASAKVNGTIVPRLQWVSVSKYDERFDRQGDVV